LCCTIYTCTRPVNRYRYPANRCCHCGAAHRHACSTDEHRVATDSHAHSCAAHRYDCPTDEYRAATDSYAHPADRNLRAGGFTGNGKTGVPCMVCFPRTR